MTPVPVAVLASGGGSNLQALLDAPAHGRAYRISLVVVNRPDALALDRARHAGVPAMLIDHAAHARREEFEDEVHRALLRAGVRWVCLAGFMRMLTGGFVARWHDRMLNVHPSLLPVFPGLHTHRRALEAGLRIAGCTVHMVRPALDDGPIVVQAAVPVLDGDDEASLAARVLVMEHRAYPLALELMVSGRAVIEGQRVRLTDPLALAPPGLLWPGPLD